MLKQSYANGLRSLSIILITLILLTAVSAVCVSAASEAKDAPVPKYKSLEELRGKRIGMQVGNDNLVWISFPIAEIASLIVSVIFFRRLYKKIISKVGDSSMAQTA